MTEADKIKVRLRADVDQRWSAAVDWIAENCEEYSEFITAIKNGDWLRVRRIIDTSPKHMKLLTRMVMLFVDEVYTRTTCADPDEP